MAERILRKVTLGIAKENVYGTANSSASTFVLGLTELSLEEVINKAENTSLLGSTYETNDLKETTRMANFTIKGKVSENELPLLLMQKFQITSEAVSGESAVYSHELAYLNNNAPSSGQSLTLFWKDTDIADQYMAGARFDKIDLVFTPGDFVYYEIAGKAKYPVTTGVVNTLSAVPLDFVGRDVTYKIADLDQEDPLAVEQILSATARHQFNLSGDDDNFVLGSNELNNVFTLQDGFQQEIVARHGDNDLKTLWENNTRIQSQFIIEDTTRYVEGSTENTRPNIQIDYAVAKISAWARSGGANDIEKQNLTIKTLDDPAIADSPILITVVNAIASY